MRKVNWRILFGQKSTIAGLIGLVASVCSAFGVAIPEPVQAQIMQIALAIVSAVAIGTQPDGKSAIKR